MSLVGFALVVAGVALFAVGFLRAREPWRRSQGLRAQDENSERYRAWRGGSPGAREEKTGASIAMQLLRRRARIWGAVATAGAFLVVVGFVLAFG